MARPGERLNQIPDSTPSLLALPGWTFHPRCPKATERCRVERPPLSPREDGTMIARHDG